MRWFAISTLAVLTVLSLMLGPPRRENSDDQKNPALASVSMTAYQAGTQVEFRETGHPNLLSPHSAPIVVHQGKVFVANTPADTLDVIEESSQTVVARIRVGIDPVSVAVRPDGKELWVSNHVSDSVSVIDIDPQSPFYLQIVATVQDIDPETHATRFDEPVGIAFAGNDKAYVALSSENQIAVVDVANRVVSGHLSINAQDPRAITVRDNRLYVIPFESNNKTQISGGVGELDGDLKTFDAWEHAIANNNVLSLGAVVDIVKRPEVPDHDLYVFDTESDELVTVVDTLGTLLYGLAVDSSGDVFVAQTDARNDANGRSGTQGHGLKEMENRAFLNQVTRVSFEGEESKRDFFDLEPLPPSQPEPGEALATPFAIQVTPDDATLVVSAAGSDKLFTVDAESGELLGRVEVDSVPRGIALSSDQDGATTAWVLNAVANTVSLVDLSEAAQPKNLATVELEDPTPEKLKRGRIAFNTATASTTETFSCASCHPDGHTDQLVWVLKTPVVTGGDQIMPRSTMPVRGLRDTEPYHWDGIPGDPYGGNNSANVYGADEPNSDPADPKSSIRHLIDGGLASTMMRVGDEFVNDVNQEGRLDDSERDDMAAFLLTVSFPPAQRRAYSNELSDNAKRGFELFHVEGDLQGDPQPNLCGNCHRMPFLVSTNTPGTGMDAPTWRGAYDRWLILPQGRLNQIDFDFYRNVAEQGIPERNVWQFSWAGRRRFDPVWDMVLEGSTGYSGAFARQVTLTSDTVNDHSLDIVNALQLAAVEESIVLEADGVLLRDNPALDSALYDAEPLSLQFVKAGDRFSYVDKSTGISYSSDELLALAEAGNLVVTLTARHGAKSDFENPQPALWTLGPIETQRGRQQFPMIHPDQPTMQLSGRHIQSDANLIVDGRRVSGRVQLGEDETLDIELETLPAVGMHFLQVQNRQGMFSNDFIFYVVENEEGATELRNKIETQFISLDSQLVAAVNRNQIRRVDRLLERGADINAQGGDDGSTPLSAASVRLNSEMVKFLLEKGADVNGRNRDGNTAMHAAAFLCDQEVMELLLEGGASLEIRNNDQQTPIDVVSSEWNAGLAGFYQGVSNALELGLDLEEIQNRRPEVAAFLEEQQSADDSDD